MAFVLSQKPPTKGAGLRSFRPGSLGEGRGFVSQKEKQKQAEVERMNRVYYEVWSITKGYQHVLVVAGPEKVTRDEMRRVIAKGLDLDVNKVMELRVFVHPDSGRVERVLGVKFDGRHEGLEEALKAGYVESERGEVLRIRRYYMPVDPSVAVRELCIRQARGVEEKEVRKVIEAKIGGLQEGDQLFQRGQEWFLRAATVPRAKKLEGMQFEWGAVGVHVRLEPVPLSMKRSGRSWTEVVRNAAAEPVEQGGQVDKRDEQEKEKEEVDDGGKMNMKISPEMQPMTAKNGAKAATAQKPRGQDPKPGPAKGKAGAGASAELAAMQEKYKEMEAKVEVLSKQIQGIQESVKETTERTLGHWMETMSKQMERVMAAVTAAKGNDGEEARARVQQVQLRVQEEEKRVREQQEDEARAQAKQLEEARATARREEEARLQREQEARANAQREQEARANAQREQEARVQADEQKRQEEEKARQKELQLGEEDGQCQK
jgi:hypothetical protein